MELNKARILGYVVLILSAAVLVGASIYGLAVNHTDTQIVGMVSEIRVMRAHIAREIERMNRSEASMTEVRDRLTRIETKVDAILERTATLERTR